MREYLPNIQAKRVIEKIKCDLSPEELFAHFDRIPEASLLNSSLETDISRFSFIGLDPFLVLKSKNGKTELISNEKSVKTGKDPFECLDFILKTYKTDNPSPFPFTSGGVGFLSYDLKDLLENIEQRSEDDLNVPDIYFVFYKTIIIFDREKKGEVYISSTGDHKNTGAIKDILMSKPEDTAPLNDNYIPSLQSNFTKEEYIRSILRIKEYIRDGDIYQLCLSQRFRTEWPHPPYSLYRKLNKINPSPFSAYLNFDPCKVISSSPELFLRVANGCIETRPMKGTRPRGESPEKDMELRENLLKSEKDKAELLMIVDLERNDLGRVAIPGSIKVKESRRIESYSTVFQTISVIDGKVDQDVTFGDILRSSFPGGSISGCPKIRAMEIIEELEPTRRGIYTGSIGYISFHDTMDLNIAIRTMIMKKNDLYFQAGGGIISDSCPETEYEETLVKAKAMIQSLYPELSPLKSEPVRTR